MGVTGARIQLQAEKSVVKKTLETVRADRGVMKRDSHKCLEIG